jgi:hypothetical protein
VCPLVHCQLGPGKTPGWPASAGRVFYGRRVVLCGGTGTAGREEGRFRTVPDKDDQTRDARTTCKPWRVVKIK